MITLCLSFGTRVERVNLATLLECATKRDVTPVFRHYEGTHPLLGEYKINFSERPLRNAMRVSLSFHDGNEWRNAICDMDKGIYNLTVNLFDPWIEAEYAQLATA